jgi:hypothetical protein
MEVDNGYVARPGAAPTNAKEVDRPGVKIAVAQRTRDCSASSNQETAVSSNELKWTPRVVSAR